MAERKVYIRDGKPEQEKKPLQPIRSAYRGSQSTAEKETAEREAREEKRRAEEQKKLDAHARLLLEKRERRRRMTLIFAACVAVASLGYVGFYMYYDYRTSSSYQLLASIRERADAQAEDAGVPAEPVIHYTDDTVETPDVLPEFADLLKINKNLIGWLTIADILPEEGLPVMQLAPDNSQGNTYYLNHNLNQQEDKNGTLFVDKDCDVIRPSTNLIIYGHHMQSGRMFGKLGKYEDESFWQTHRTFTFDTIYEHATYEVMYVFRSHVFDANEIAFKYYQFIDVNGEVEFASNMAEMEAMSFYDTGVTAQYGDHLLTLSTCDYEEANGRFVVVAKKSE